MKALILITALTSMTILSACTGREVATGAAAGVGGYVLGRHVEDNKHD